ncbi:hypothetical protein BST61_g11046 [Cercospora zeina]
MLAVKRRPQECRCGETTATTKPRRTALDSRTIANARTVQHLQDIAAVQPHLTSRKTTLQLAESCATYTLHPSDTCSKIAPRTHGCTKRGQGRAARKKKHKIMAQNSKHNNNPSPAITATAQRSNNKTGGASPPAAEQHEQNADTFIDTITAAMPPSMEAKRTKTASELLAEMNRVPLFMTTLDETDGAGGENLMLEAIKALAYEGTKAEVAANFREQGNEAARAKNWRDAREFYSKAIASVQGKVKLVEGPEKELDLPSTSTERMIDVTELDDATAAKKGTGEVLDEEAEWAQEREIEEACFANRALCNLELKNYGQTITDSASTLRLNPQNIKALYRAASACLALDKLPEAHDAITKGLTLDPTNTSLSTLSQKLQARKTLLDHLASKRQAREEQQRQESLALKQQQQQQQQQQ